MIRVLIATGGTGGHIYPALFTAEELRDRGCEVCFTGVLGDSVRRISAAGFICRPVEAAGFVARRFGVRLVAAGLLLRGIGRSLGIIREFRPQVVVGFGGYASCPAVLAAFLSGIPIVLHEQNAVPGAANRWLSRLAVRVCTGFRQTANLFSPARAVWTGTPFRLPGASVDRQAALASFGLKPDLPTVLVFGGSQGSRRINACVHEWLLSFPGELPVQVILATGRAGREYAPQKFQSFAPRVCVREYIENMDEAYAACDLVVARAGAGTVCEIAAQGVSAIMIPYPGANGHQLENAQVLERCGAGVIIEEKSLSSAVLGDKIFLELGRKTSRSDLQKQVSAEFYGDTRRRLADEVLAVCRGV